VCYVQDAAFLLPSPELFSLDAPMSFDDATFV
jgi:hypothetical protein